MQGSKARRGVLAGMTLVVVLLVVLVALRGKQLGPVSSAVFQSISVVLSVYGGIVFAREGNDERVKAAAVSSVRRVAVNSAMIGRMGEVINELRSRMSSFSDSDGKLDHRDVDLALTGLQDQVTMQLMSADSAVQDWRDLAPDEVDKEIQRIREIRESQ